MSSSTTRTQQIVRHALTIAMSVCFIAGGWLLLKPLVRPAIAEAAVASVSPKWTTKAIEEIAVGDMVLARDEHGTELGWKPVKEVYRRTAYELVHLSFRDTAGQEQTFETTDEHPFWSVTTGAFVNAGELVIGDQVTSSPQSDDPTANTRPALLQTLTAIRHEAHPNGIAVYNFQVDDFHTYFVAARGATGPPVLVHNAEYASGIQKSTAQLNREANIANGIPGSQLGPSGMPKIHVASHSSLKRAQDAARARAGKGGTTVKHPSPVVGGPHFHGIKLDETKVRVHDVFPGVN